MNDAAPDDEMRLQLDAFRSDFERLRGEVSKVIVGHREILDDTLIALIAGGHVLLEGVPGLGKTLLVRTLADALHLKFQRIQFTPDLMPADLIGTNVVLQAPDGTRRFEFQKGPVFANILLADEINRAPPKPQPALLESVAAPMTKQYVRYGSSPRGAQAIILAAKLRAILDNRYHVAREDIRAVAPAALRHRLILNFEGQAEGLQTDAVIANVMETVQEPA